MYFIHVGHFNFCSGTVKKNSEIDGKNFSSFQFLKRFKMSSCRSGVLCSTAQLCLSPRRFAVTQDTQRRHCTNLPDCWDPSKPSRHGALSSFQSANTCSHVSEHHLKTHGFACLPECLLEPGTYNSSCLLGSLLEP